MAETSYSDIKDALAGSCRSLWGSINVLGFAPASVVTPAAIIKPRKAPFSVDYLALGMSDASAEWYWWVQLLMGRVNEQTAQDKVGALISPGSELIRALNATKINDGYVQASRAIAGETRAGPAMYASADILVIVRA